MMMKSVFTVFSLIIYLLVASRSEAQNNPESHDAENIQNQNLEVLSEQMQDEQTDYTPLIEQQSYFKSYPINLNSTDKSELLSLGLFSEIQINNLLQHIAKNGKLISIYELQGIEGFEDDFIKIILPYITVRDQFTAAHFTFSEMIKNGKFELTTRAERLLETQPAYQKFTDSILKYNPRDYYLGTPERIFTRFRFRYSTNVSFGFSAEKDAGEPLKKIDSLSKKKGFDFYTFHLHLKNIKHIKSLTIGDFQATFGQGLVLWRGFGLGKSAVITSIKRNASGFTPYTSMDENRFFRGIATTFKLKKIETSLFISSKKTDANLQINWDSVTVEKEYYQVFSNFIMSGAHRTIDEIKNKNQITETTGGGNITFKNNRFSLGATAKYTLLSHAISVRKELENRYDFSGKNNFNGGIDFSYVYKNMNFFGEGAIAQTGSKALVLGSMMVLDPRFTLVSSIRHFDKNYQNLQGLAVSENTLPQNESGIYLGCETRISKTLSFTLYYDNFIFPWLNYRASKPTKGHDVLTQLNWNPSKKTEMYARYRYRLKEQDAGAETLFDYPIDVEQQNLRYHVGFQVNKYLKIRSRFDYVIYQKANAKTEYGSAMYQDLVFKKMGDKLEVTARFTLFDTDSYNTRIYGYENDVLYSFSIPALYDKGTRTYLLLNYELNKHVEIWARIAQTFYANKRVLNPGTPTQINSNTKTEVKFQLRITW